MFKNLQRELDRLSSGGALRIPVESDERGYLDKECPAEQCQYQFKVKEEDWGALFNDEAVYCPLCGHCSGADEWWTTEQVQEAQEQAFQYIQGTLDRAMHRDAREFNRGQPKRGMLQVSMKVKGATSKWHGVMPLKAAEILEQEITCEQCAARYAVMGAAFFCPCCGHNSVERMFSMSVRKIRTKVEQLDTIRSAVADAQGKDEAEALCRSVLESALVDCVAAFQSYAEHRYRKYSGNEPRLNAFQRLDEGSRLWREAVGARYEDWLGKAALDRLHVLFQRRHLLAHRDGLVDDKYLQNTEDGTYRVGQRIVVAPRDVAEMADHIEALAQAIYEATG